MRRVIAVLMFALCALVQVQAQAQSPYPSKPVKLIVAFPPGGSTDVTARLLASKLQDKWGQPVVVENRPGAGANIGTAFVAHAAPDGHNPAARDDRARDQPEHLCQRRLRRAEGLRAGDDGLDDPERAGRSSVGAGGDDRRVHRVREGASGKLNFAAPGASSGQRMTFELIKQLTGTDVVMVPYAGGTPALQAVLGGQVEAMIVNVVEASTYVRAGKLRALATTTARRAALLPEVPTLAETVAPRLDTSVWQGLLVPAATPASIIQQLNRDVGAVLALPDVAERLGGLGMDVVPGPPEAFGRFVKDEIDTWRRVANAAGVKPE
jgi:tripartite-type tricarboxylate transporter receptor subunit TctC